MSEVFRFKGHCPRSWMTSPRWIIGLKLQVCKGYVILTDSILQTCLWVLRQDDVIEVSIMWSVTSLTILRFLQSKGAKLRQRKAELQSSLLSVGSNLFIPGMIWLWLRPVPMLSVCLSLSSLRGVMGGKGSPLFLHKQRLWDETEEDCHGQIPVPGYWPLLCAIFTSGTLWTPRWSW